MPKAPNHQVQQFDGTPLESALIHVAEGWAVFPLRGKVPLTENGVYDASRDPSEVSAMFQKVSGRVTGVGGSCDGRVVVDVDPRNGGQFPDGLPPTRVHYSGRGDGGCHLIYTLPPGVGGLRSSTQDISEGVDIKTGEGSYVVLPGSTHPDTGGRYTANTVDPVDIPADLLQQLRDHRGSSTTRGQSLASLLANPPEVGGRNEWLTKVAGHYARQYRLDEDSYHQSVVAANRLLRDSLDPDEVAKTADSIWTAEMESYQDPELEKLLDESNGWIVSGGDCMRTLAWEGTAKKRIMVPYDLASFDLRVQARLWDPETEAWIYECDVHNRHRPEVVDRILINANDFGNPRTARSVLASRALAVGSGADLVHRAYDWCSRILRYLDSQPAPERTLVRRLGWVTEEGGYVVGDGAIDQEGHRETATVVPDRSLHWVGDTYGQAGSVELAQETLAEVLHFQEPETAALFGSWWAATLVKQWIQPRVSMFPVCAVEAASGSGKTTGFFSLMSDLAGSTVGEGHYTPAVLRNRLAANLNGITWVDDLENPEAIHEMIRVLTAGGSLSKMSSNNEPVHFELVGSLLLSGEALGFQSQKALRDRVLRLAPPPPHGRMSIHDATRSQWSDVVSLRERLQSLGGGQQLAGHYLRMAASLAPRITEWFLEERSNHGGGGRLRDRDLVLLVGARVLEHLAGPVELRDDQGKAQSPYAWVSDWVTEAESLSPAQRLELSGGGEAFDGDNTVTTKLIPAYLSEHGIVRMPGAAVIIDSEKQRVLVSANRLAKWWDTKNHGRTNLRTESPEAVLAQLRQLRTNHPDEVRYTTTRLDGGRNTSPKRVWALSGELYEVLIARLDYH